MKRVSILGSTGSIGQSTCKVLRALPGEFRCVALAARSNVSTLAAQISEFHPELVAVADPVAAKEIRQMFPDLCVLEGSEGITELAGYSGADIVVSALVGIAGLEPTLAAIDAGKDIALANKEVLVAAGELVTQRCRDKGVKLLPVDSEHSALFQCLEANNAKEVSRLILTASGGALRDYSKEALQKATLEDALKHPNWSMGAKVTIDSSTLMNKGLEVIEARWLFEIEPERIDVVIHPQSIVHSMVEYRDGSTLAQLSYPDMVLPIQYALSYPRRHPGLLRPLDFTSGLKLDFYKPDTERFRCLDLAFWALREGKSYTCFLNAANEVLVERFMQKKIGWWQIATTLDSLLQRHKPQAADSLEALRDIDSLARHAAIELIG